MSVDTPEDIWAGDKLGRREEATALEVFLTSETAHLRATGRHHGFVLGLDAPYGEGKSWFLERLARQLSLNHPVVRVDAWADDAGSEPLVALMASIEDSLKPYLIKPAIRDKFAKAKASLLPVIGKGALAMGGRLVARYAGEEFKDQAGELLAGHADDKAIDKAVDDAAEGAQKKVEALIDRAAERMLKDYRERKRSTGYFKEQLEAVVEALDGVNTHPPIYIILDELDRCRPSYAIRMLEEIKHIFDVPGLVFVVALHGDQLERSISAVYGAEFDAKDYLQRFFSRRYRLSRPSVATLGQELFAQLGAAKEEFSYPAFWHDGKVDQHEASILVGRLLAHWKVTPRRVFAVIDCLRLFRSQWRASVPIELPLVLNMVVQWVAGDSDKMTQHVIAKGEPFNFLVTKGNQFGSRREFEPLPPSVLMQKYTGLMVHPLNKASDWTNQGGAEGYISYRLLEEFSKLHGNSYQGNNPPKSIWNLYARWVEHVGRFVAPQATLDTA